MPHVVHITTVPESLIFVSGLVRFLDDRGWRVTVISSAGRALIDFAREHPVDAVQVDMARAITPMRDLGAVSRLTDALLDIDPDVVHAHTPKGGLLGMIAATAAMVPAKVYQMRGLVTLTARGAKGALLSAAERTSCRLADHVACQSHSLRQVALESGLVSADRSSVLANGGNGIDADGRFNPVLVTGLDVRRQLGIGDDAPVIGFVGRLVRDKGVVELVDAWRVLKAAHPQAHLLVVGPFEVRDAVPQATARALRDDPNVHLVGFVRDTPRYYEAMNFLVLPSHREGFPNAPMEAAAMGIPCVTTNAVGCRDAVVDGVTGFTAEVGDVRELARAMRRYVESPELCVEHGATARARVLSDFRPALVHEAVLALYQRLRSD